MLPSIDIRCRGTTRNHLTHKKSTCDRLFFRVKGQKLEIQCPKCKELHEYMLHQGYLVEIPGTK